MQATGVGACPDLTKPPPLLTPTPPHPHPNPSPNPITLTLTPNQAPRGDKAVEVLDGRLCAP